VPLRSQKTLDDPLQRWLIVDRGIRRLTLLCVTDED